MKVNHKKISKLLKKTFKTKTSMYLEGAAGIGKSYLVRQEAKLEAVRLEREFIDFLSLPTAHKVILANPANVKARSGKYLFVDFRVAQADPTDMKGVPSMINDYVTWLPPMFLKILSYPEAAGIIFLDELNLAPPSVQGAAYQLVLDKAIGEIALSKQVTIIAAGNRLTDKASVFDRAAPLKNRFRNVELTVPSPKEWIDDFALANKIDERLIAYVKFSNKVFEDYTKKTTGDNFMTPRSLVALSKDIEGETLANELYDYASSLIGEADAIKFKEFIKLRDTIDLPDLLANPEKFGKLPIDLKYATISALTGYYAQNGSKVVKQFGPLISGNHVTADLAVILIKMCQSANNRFKSTLLADPDVAEAVADYVKYL